MDDATRRVLMWGVLPVWIGSGLADWLCHRRSDIEHTAGSREALIHALMMTEAGVPLILGLFAEINAGVLILTTGGLALHQATAVWDVAYAESRREVTPTEQHVHGLLEQAPVMATAFLVTLHWDQARALLPAVKQRPRFRLQSKRRPLKPTTQMAVLAMMATLGIIPYVEEVLRCRKVERASHPL